GAGDRGPQGVEPLYGGGQGARPARGRHGGDRGDQGRHRRRARPRALGEPARRPSRTMIKISRKEFEALVDRALRRLPRRFRDRLENIAVVVEDWADDETLDE